MRDRGKTSGGKNYRFVLQFTRFRSKTGEGSRSRVTAQNTFLRQITFPDVRL